jgi:hypothetical protein
MAAILTRARTPIDDGIGGLLSLPSKRSARAPFEVHASEMRERALHAAFA